MVAPPFGGVLYEFCGKAVPFIILAFVCLFDGFLMILIMRPMKAKQVRFIFSSNYFKHISYFNISFNSIPISPVCSIFVTFNITARGRICSTRRNPYLASSHWSTHCMLLWSVGSCKCFSCFPWTNDFKMDERDNGCWGMAARSHLVRSKGLIYQKRTILIEKIFQT